MVPGLDRKTGAPKRFCYAYHEVGVQPAEQYFFFVAGTAVNRYHLGAAAQQRETGRLVESIACDVKSLVVRRLTALEKIKVELLAGNRLRYVTRMGLYQACVGRDHGRAGRRAQEDRDCVVYALPFVCSELGEITVSIHG